jgi:hypothetical protein
MNTQIPEPAASPATSSAATAKPAGASSVTRKRRGHASLTRKNRIGLVLTFVLGLANLPSVLQQTPDGKEGPPMGVLVLDTVCGVLMVAAVVIAWRTGSRGAIRAAAGVTILQALSAVPAFFVDISAGIKIVAAAAVVVSFVAVVLTLSPGRSSTAVTD